MVWIWLIMIIIAAVQAPVLIRHRWWKELAAFSGLWLIALVYASLVAAEAPLPTVLEATKHIFRLLGLDRQ